MGELHPAGGGLSYGRIRGERKLLWRNPRDHDCQRGASRRGRAKMTSADFVAGDCELRLRNQQSRLRAERDTRTQRHHESDAKGFAQLPAWFESDPGGCGLSAEFPKPRKAWERDTSINFHLHGEKLAQNGGTKTEKSEQRLVKNGAGEGNRTLVSIPRAYNA